MKNSTINPSRRRFILTSATVGGGFALGLQLPTKAQMATGGGSDINIWVQISPDDLVTIKYARCEMGQGSMTSAPQIVADELDANWGTGQYRICRCQRTYPYGSSLGRHGHRRQSDHS